MSTVSLRSNGQWTALGNLPGAVATPNQSAPITFPRGFNISPRSSDYGNSYSPWTSLWYNWDWTGKIKRDIDLAVGMGAKFIRIIGAAPGVAAGTISLSAYMAEQAQVIEYCASQNIQYYPSAGDTDEITTGTIPAGYENVLLSQAALLASNSSTAFGLDLSNEISHSFTTYGGSFDQVTLCTTAGQWAQDIKQVAPSLLLTTSSLHPSISSAYTSYSYIDPYLDFYDFHTYEPFTGADVITWTAYKPVMIGEFGYSRTDPVRAQVLYEIAKAASVGQVMGAGQWDICSSTYGLYDGTGANLDSLLLQGWQCFAPTD